MQGFGVAPLFKRALRLSPFALPFVALAALVGCGMKAETAASGSTTGGSGSSASAYKMKLTVSSFWETSTSSTATVLGTCSATTTTANVPKTTCSISVPEGQLFYSKLVFKIESDAEATCSQISFRPYYYLMSKSAGFFTPGTSTGAIDCSGVLWQTTLGCWNGPGTTILGTAALLRSAAGVYYTPTATTLSKTYEMASSPNDKYSSLNASTRYSANDLADATVSVATGNDPYVATGGDCTVGNNNPAGGQCYFDWYFECRDAYNERQYSITARIVEVDGATDSFTDWTP